MKIRLSFFAFCLLSLTNFMFGCSRVFLVPPIDLSIKEATSIRRYDAGYPIKGIRKIKFRCEVPALTLSQDGKSLLYAMKCSNFSSTPRMMIHESHTLLIKDGVPVSDHCFNIKEVAFDATGDHYAARITHVIDNREQAGLILDRSTYRHKWEDIGTLVFHPSSGSVAHKVFASQFANMPNGKFFAGKNGQIVSQSFSFIYDPVVFAPQSETLAFAGKREGKWAIYIGNNKASADYKNISAPAFHPQSGALFFGAQEGDTWSLVGPEGKLSDNFDEIGRPQFSPDGAHIAYKVKKGNDWCMAFDHIVFPQRFERIGEPVFSKNSAHIAYRACNGLACFVMKDDKQVSDDFILVDNISLNSDGSAVLYSAQAGTRSDDLASDITYFIMKDRKRVSPMLRTYIVGRWIDDANIAFAGFDEFEDEMIHGTTH
ncbi:MAG: hypothetical protein ABIK15_04100 [Pseudomonadota bacterium]